MNSRFALHELARPAASRGWRIERYVHAIAGTLILAGTLLALTGSRWWLAVPAFVGVNLLQSSLTGWCLMSNLLGAMLERE